MILTVEQREKVEQNIRLVQKVINDKVHGPYQLGIYTYDDIFQIGCIGLCKAAATDKGGTFSTYAYRLIWNEICDALIYSTRRQATELSSDMIPLVAEDPTVSIADVATQLDVQAVLKAAKQKASPCVIKGIDAMIQMAEGRSSKEIGNEFGVSATHLLKQRLVQEVKNDLLFADLSVKEIAYNLQFSAPNHLMRFFKQQTNMTVGEFLKEVRNNGLS